MKVGDSMAMTRIISENENNLIDALNNGISPDAVTKTLENMIEKSNRYAKSPKQVKTVVNSLVSMKEVPNSRLDYNYQSNYVRQNSEKIKAATVDGLTPAEIRKTLTERTDNAIDKNNKDELRFTVRLVSSMKQLEKRMSMQQTNEKSYQKIKM